MSLADDERKSLLHEGVT